jgi:hypothetical protein
MIYTIQKKAFLFLCLLTLSGCVLSQGFSKDDIIASGSIGFPHLDKFATKINAQREEFKTGFKGTVEAFSVKGTNPLVFRYEYALSKYFGLGFDLCWYSIVLSFKDHYNTGTAPYIRSETDSYTFRITSTSFGIRPNYHIPLKHKNRDFFIGCAIGVTRNHIALDFNSTVNSSYGFYYDFKMPNKFYIAPTAVYRVFIVNNFGLNFELGYEKGALLQAGMIFRFRPIKFEMPK